jgi:type VI secretion system protein ImpE
MPTTQAGVLFQEGKLSESIAAASASVKQSPSDAGGRFLLAELLLFEGSFARAEAVLDAAQSIDPNAALMVAEFRQLLRAAESRRQLARDGRVPEFVGGPTQSQQLLLQALVDWRSGDRSAAATAVEAAEAARPCVSGTSNGTAFVDFRDVDDLVSGNFEVLTTTGKYFWIPVERVVSLEFHAPKRPRDLFWRRCSMMVRGGPEGDVYLPAMYEADATCSDNLRLGRATEWAGPTPFRGSGQRVFLMGEEGAPIHELETIEFG